MDINERLKKKKNKAMCPVRKTIIKILKNKIKKKGREKKKKRQNSRKRTIKDAAGCLKKKTTKILKDLSKKFLREFKYHSPNLTISPKHIKIFAVLSGS